MHYMNKSGQGNVHYYDCIYIQATRQSTHLLWQTYIYTAKRSEPLLTGDEHLDDIVL